MAFATVNSNFQATRALQQPALEQQSSTLKALDLAETPAANLSRPSAPLSTASTTNHLDDLSLLSEQQAMMNDQFNEFAGDEPISSNMNDRSADQGPIIPQGEKLVRNPKLDLVDQKLYSLLSKLSFGRGQANTLRDDAFAGGLLAEQNAMINDQFNEFASDDPISSDFGDRAEDAILTDRNVLGLPDSSLSKGGIYHLANMGYQSADQGQIISQGEKLVRNTKPNPVALKLNSLLSKLSISRVQANAIRDAQRELELRAHQLVNSKEGELKALLTLQQKTGIQSMSELKIGVQFIQRKRALIESNPNAALITKLDKNGQLAKYERMRHQHKGTASVAKLNNDRGTLIKNGAEEMRMLKKMGVNKNEDINAIIKFLDAKANLLKAAQVLPLMEVAGDIAKIEKHM